jgi:tetratricopeptide (TPR) repeat protein
MPPRSETIGSGADSGGMLPARRIGTVLRSAFALAAALLPLQGLASPHRPTDDTEIVERLPSAGNATVRDLRRLHETLRRTPDNLPLALIVARHDIEAGRAEADPRFNGYAEAALAPWLDLPKPPPTVLLLRATLRQSRHEFPAALDDLDQVIAVEPRNAQAWLTRAVILQVQGEYAMAGASCDRLQALVEPFIYQICDAGIRTLGNGAERAYDALRRSLDSTGAAAAKPLRLWALTVLGEAASRLGDPEAAERHFRDALALGLDDTYLLGAFADFLLDRGRPEEVVALLADKTRIDPLMLRLTLAEAMQASPDFGRDRADLTQRFAAARLRGDRTHLREEARFTLSLLHEPEAALALAEANWAVQREPWDARVLLEAALAANRPEAARPVLAALAATRRPDAQLFPLIERLGGLSR